MSLVQIHIYKQIQITQTNSLRSKHIHQKMSRESYDPSAAYPYNAQLQDNMALGVYPSYSQIFRANGYSVFNTIMSIAAMDIVRFTFYSRNQHLFQFKTKQEQTEIICKEGGKRLLQLQENWVFYEEYFRFVSQFNFEKEFIISHLWNPLNVELRTRLFSIFYDKILTEMQNMDQQVNKFEFKRMIVQNIRQRNQGIYQNYEFDQNKYRTASIDQKNNWYQINAYSKPNSFYLGNFKHKSYNPSRIYRNTRAIMPPPSANASNYGGELTVSNVETSCKGGEDSITLCSFV